MINDEDSSRQGKRQWMILEAIFWGNSHAYRQQAKTSLQQRVCGCK